MIYLPEEFGCSLGASGQKLVGTGQTAVGPGWIAAELGSIVEGTFSDEFLKSQGKKLIYIGFEPLVSSVHKTA